MNPDLSIIILNHNTRDLLKNCLISIFKYQGILSLQVIVVDNASSDGSADMVTKSFPQVHLISNQTNSYYSHANNQALRVSTGRYVLFLNSDTLMHPQTLTKMCKFMNKHPNCGISSCCQINAQGLTLKTCHRFSTPLTELLELPMFRKFFPNPELLQNFRYQNWDRHTTRFTDTVPGSFLFSRRSVLDLVGGFDEKLSLFYSDADLCKRVKDHGYQIYHYAGTSFTHLTAQTIQQFPLSTTIKQSYQDMTYYYKKHHGYFWFLILKFLSQLNLLYFYLTENSKTKTTNIPDS